MAELRVPEHVENPFRHHYRGLILGSALRVAEAESERRRSRGQQLRARRSERDAGRLRTVAGEPARSRRQAAGEELWFGGSLRLAVGLVWLVAAALLLVDVVFEGVRGWTTAAADLGLVVLTAVRFAVSLDDLLPATPPSAEQLELFD